MLILGDFSAQVGDPSRTSTEALGSLREAPSAGESFCALFIFLGKLASSTLFSGFALLVAVFDLRASVGAAASRRLAKMTRRVFSMQEPAKCSQT